MWVRRADEIPVDHDPAFEEAHVARQQNASIVSGEVRQRRIGCAGGICRVDATEAQAPRELAEMDIGDESDAGRGPRAHTCDCPDIKDCKRREHRDPIAALYRVIERHGYAVDENQINFRMGYAQALDDIFH